MAEYLLAFTVGASIVAMAYAALMVVWVLRQDPGDERMREISGWVGIGASAFLRKEYSVLAPLALILAFVIGVAVGWQNAVDFLIGAALSALAGYLGMAITVRASSRAAQAAKNGMGPALALAFRGGSVMGMSVIGLGLLGSALLYGFFKDPLLIVGFGFGASLIAMFIRVGGGIYTKAADLGADLVGKVEAGIPEDDPRNPAVIADNVGDNVGDCAGMGSDVFESFVVIAVAAMLLGYLAFGIDSVAVVYPLTLAACGVFGSLAGSLIIRSSFKGENAMSLLNKAFYIAAVVTAILNFVVTNTVYGFSNVLGVSLYVASLIGLAVVVVIERVTDYFTSYEYSPVRSISESSQVGPATNFLTGFAVGLMSTFPSAIVIIITLMASFSLGYWASGFSLIVGIYSTAITTMAMLSMTGIVMSIDSFGPITDNANGIVEMASVKGVREVTDRLDAVGNTTKATTKGFAIMSAALAALSLFQAFQNEAAKSNPNIAFDLTNPLVLVGLIIGGLLPFIFSAFLIKAVGRTGSDIVKEVRRQFKEIKGILEGTARPDYARCVSIATSAALRQLAAPGLLAVLSPILVGVLFGPIAVGGLLIGSVISGVFLAFAMANGGAAWDNAKKYIELGNYGGKNTPAHAASVIGDTVGDPFKDAAGPSINSLIKVINTISIIFLPIFIGILIRP